MTGPIATGGHQEGLPAALPPEALSTGLFPPVSAPEGRNTGGKVQHPVIHSRDSVPLRAAAGARARTPGARRMPGRGPGITGLRELLTQLSPRDRLILTLIGDHKFVTTRQLQDLAFTQHASELSAARTTRRVLGRLHREGLLTSLPRRVGGMFGGAENPIWHLTPTGYRLVHLAAGHTDGGAPLRIREPSKRIIEHCLAVANARIAVERTAREAGDVVVASVITEPATWRRYTGPMGTTELLKPDLELVTQTTDGQFEDRWFLEIDLDTEHPPVVVRQCQQYEDYRRTSNEQERHAVFPLVVWVVPDEIRADKLRRAIHAARGLDPELFVVITQDELGSRVRDGGGGEL